jgi:hypothetical protein
MTSQEFIIWMKGFVSAANDYTPTPKQWEILKDELSKVSDYEDREQLENDFFGAYDADMGTEPTLDDLQIGPDGAYFDGFDDYGKRIEPCKGHAYEDDEFELGGSE